ncbi:MAG TPA: enoyl-CoA hydratase/isomerase family protein [Acidimicrobiales bacterium]
MSDHQTVLYEERQGVAWVTLNRPEVHNAIDDRMSIELREIWASLRSNESVNCVVITGSGDRAFTTGRDRSEALKGVEGEGRAGFASVPFHFDGAKEQIGPKSADLWIPVLCAVNGMACGNAFFLVGEADIVIASERATFFDPHVTFGLASVSEAVQMSSRMPFGEVARMVLLGSHERLSAARALDIGLVSEVTPAERLLERARWIAESISSQPRLAVQATVRALWMARELSRSQATGLSWAMIALGNAPDQREAGLREFAAGRRVDWQVR